MDMYQRAVQLAPVLWRKLGLSTGGTPMAFPAVLDQEAMEFQLEVVWDLLVQKFVGLITGHSRVRNPLVLFGDSVDVCIYREFIPPEGKQ